MPDSVDLWALSDLCTPWCLHTAVTFRIAEHIAEGIEGIDDLAQAAGCDSYVLHCMLGHLVKRGVFAEPEPGRFTLNEAARGLLDPGTRLGLDLDGLGGRFAAVWSTMPEYVRTGRPAYTELFDRPFWDDLDAHPRLAAEFDEIIGPTGHGTPDGDVPLSISWDQVGTVVDVGGGTGAMLAEMLRLHPQSHGVLVDRPATVARSAEILRSAGVEGRASVSGQSFFDALPPADLYCVRGVLNDWPDEDCVAILKRCAEGVRPGGRVVIIKGIAPDNATRDIMIEMILCGGKQRTAAEFEKLAARSGLEMVAVGKQPSGQTVLEFRATR
jgi:precorrin-6B methylase 2